MCEPIEIARIIDVGGASTILKTTCRRNRSILSLSIMAKIRPAQKVDHHGSDMRALFTTVMLSSSVGSSCSYSSSPDSEGSCEDLEDMINSMMNLEVKAKVVDLSLSDDSDEYDDDDELVERGPLRPQFQNRPRPYLDTAGHGPWQAPGENSTDYDTSAKAILTDTEYRQKIDICLNALTDAGIDSLSPVSSYSPPQQQHSYLDRSPGCSKSCVPSITVCDSESSLLEILSRGGFQPAQTLLMTPEHPAMAGSDHWPDSPASSSNACATSASRPDSRASSRAHSPGSNNGCASFLNVVGSPMGSPQVSPQGFRHTQLPSSSSSSSQSYCETPSPANYLSPLDQHSEEQLGDHMLTRLPVWKENFESTDTLVNSSELHLQLVDEVIRGDMSKTELQVVPQTPPTPSYTVTNNLDAGTPEAGTDDLTNTLLKFVGSDQAVVAHRKVEPRCSPATSGYSSSSSCGDVIKSCCDAYALEKKNIYLDGPSQPVYQPRCINSSASVENLKFSNATSVELLGRSTWPNYPDSNPVARSSAVNGHFNNFQVPESVISYNIQRPNSSSSKGPDKVSCGRSIAPWPSLNLPSTRASSRLKEMTNPRDVDRAMKSLLKTSNERLTMVDRDGDTLLMCLTGNPCELQKKLPFLVPLVERMGTIEGSLTKINKQGMDALYLACMECPRMAYVAGYLAAAFLQKNIDIGRKLYQPKGETLIHALASKGDAHGEVLAELLSLKTPQGTSVFDLSKHNYDGKTPLHIAVETHESMYKSRKIVSLGSARLLLEMGADPTIRDSKCGNTALHTAINLNADPALIKILITVGRGPEAVHMTNYDGNTPLHLAASMSQRMNLDRQLETCWQLIRAGAKTNLQNHAGKMPLALASPDRREVLRRLFHKKS